MNRLELNQISKKKGNALLLDEIAITMNGGEITVLSGENGSGKTMLLRVISGLVFPTSGEILWNGTPLYKKNHSACANIGLTLEHSGLYPQLTGLENLLLLAGIRKLASDKDAVRAMKRVGLNPSDSRPFRKYSLGMRQRLMIAQAVMEKPDILLLDEPTSALDEKGRRLIHEVLKEEAARGAVVVIASHSRDDIRECCNRMIRLEEGRVTAEYEKNDSMDEKT